MAKRTPKTLYHYCSLDTFCSIIKNRSIWLSDISKSNDSMELGWIKSKFDYFIMSKWIEYCELETRSQIIEKKDFDKFYDTQKFTDYLMKHDDIITSFVFCLSECCDDLSQWRGYADDGKGISIGFKSDIFFKMANEYFEKVNDYNFNFCPIKYEDKDDCSFFNKFSEYIDFSSDMKTDELLVCLEKLGVLTMELAPSVKSRSFLCEKEWRLILNSRNDFVVKDSNQQIEIINSFVQTDASFSKVNYTVKNNDLVGHIEMKFANMKDVISEVVIGPKCKVKVEELKRFLISNDIISEDQNIVTKSVSTYR